MRSTPQMNGLYQGTVGPPGTNALKKIIKDALTAFTGRKGSGRRIT
jgi:hypothetical protein